jgi:hypothetical protein
MGFLKKPMFFFFISAVVVQKLKFLNNFIILHHRISEGTGNRNVNHEGAPRRAAARQVHEGMDMRFQSPVFARLPRLCGKFLPSAYPVF